MVLRQSTYSATWRCVTGFVDRSSYRVCESADALCFRIVEHFVPRIVLNIAPIVDFLGLDDFRH